MNEKLGARVFTNEAGFYETHFGVWAPTASQVSLVCDANSWTPGVTRMRSIDDGIWSVTIPGIGPGTKYKYAIQSYNGRCLEKSDPCAFYSEPSPKTASIVFDIDGFPWSDQEWMQSRSHTNLFERPISIYEVHLGSWKFFGEGPQRVTYRELAKHLIAYVKQMGYSHIQLMPLTEYPFNGSWGYQTTGYYAPTSRFGNPHDFMFFINCCHENGIGVLIDWVPAHFPNDPHGLCQFDGSHLYEHADARQGQHPDWGTCIFNYGRFEVRQFLIDSARFWLENYHVDGIRVDAVASMLYLDYSRNEGEWIPNQHGGRENLEAIQFLKDLNTTVHREFPGILTIAEESTSWDGVTRPVHDGGLGFSLKWDMGWMNDTLKYLERDPIYRSHHQDELSFRMVYAFHENFVLPLSHDEVVHGKCSLLSKMPGDDRHKFANLRLLYGYQTVMPGKKLLFMGGEFGQREEWNHDRELHWISLESEIHKELRRYVIDLNILYRAHPALYELDCHPDGFSWIQCDDHQNCVFAFCRYAKSQRECLLVVMNNTPIPRTGYELGVPHEGEYSLVMNSDDKIYGGGNAHLASDVFSNTKKNHGHLQSVSFDLPPLSILIFKHVVNASVQTTFTEAGETR